MKKHLLLLGAACLLLTAHAQDSLVIAFQATFGSEPLQPGRNYTDAHENEIQVDRFSFYLSHLSLSENGKTVWKDSSTARLVDFHGESCILRFKIPQKITFDSLHFTFGTDSLLNTAGVFGGDLDPIRGMYWTWQSGYINCKLEGSSPQAGTRDHRFAFHIGGYSFPHETARAVALATKNARYICIETDLAVFFRQQDIRAGSRVMSPGKKAAELSGIFAKLFRIP